MIKKLMSLPNKIKFAILSAIAIVLAVSIFMFNKNGTKTTYKEFKVEKRDIAVSILSTGTVQPENRLEIKAPVPGRIDQVLVLEGDKVKKGQIIAWMSSTERAALIDAARSQGADEVKKWQEIYRPTPIIAPLPGMIIRRNIEPGQTITSTEATLVMSDRLTVKAQVDETDLAKIKVRQKAIITLDAYPDSKISAQVDQIAYEAKTVNNVTTYIVDVLPEKAPETMRSGMTANVNFVFDKKENVLSIPNETLLEKDGATKVLLKKPDSKTPVEVALETGLTNGKFTEVLSGLNEGDIVVRAEISGQATGGKNPFSPMGQGRKMPGTSGPRGR